VAYPAVNPTAYVNNNNYQAAMLPGALANPTPGTMVVHFNGKVVAEMQAAWTSLDARTFTAGRVTGTAKLEPLAMQYYARLYAGMDPMATNGLRYGAAMEIRMNNSGAISSSSSTNASGLSCLQTLYVRRAFVYAAGDNWSSAAGGLGGSDAQNTTGTNPSFWFLSTQGAEYAYNKLVCISPQFAGIDFGFQYAPQITNGFGLSNSTSSAVNGLLTGGTGIGWFAHPEPVRGRCALSGRVQAWVCWPMQRMKAAATPTIPAPPQGRRWGFRPQQALRSWSLRRAKATLASLRAWLWQRRCGPDLFRVHGVRQRHGRPGEQPERIGTGERRERVGLHPGRQICDRALDGRHAAGRS
jgi:hypothetical protein